MDIVTIVVQDSMLAAATGLSRISGFYPAKQTILLQKKRCQARNSTYPAWYLFGCPDKKTAGLVAMYTHYGYEVTICPESNYNPVTIGPAALLDLQLSSSIYERPGSAWSVSGFLPYRYANKAEQAGELALGGNECFLPSQFCFCHSSTPELPLTMSDTFIVKDTIGSAYRGRDGIPYTVWQREYLAAALPGLLDLLPPGRKLVISEFVYTCDYFAGNADHVVHKMPFTSSRGVDGTFSLQPYGEMCQLIIHRCNRERLEQVGVLPLAEYIGPPEYRVGQVSAIREFDRFSRALSFLARSRLVLSVDFIVPPDGLPRFLEVNKLGATFAETFDPDLPPVIDAYPGLPL